MTSGLLLPLAIDAYTATCTVGSGRAAVLDALRAERSGLAQKSFAGIVAEGWIGEVANLDKPLPSPWSDWDCRNHRIAHQALSADGFDVTVNALARRVGADRIGVFLGTSTSGVLHTEMAFRERAADGELPDWYDYRTTQSTASLAEFVRLRLGVTGVYAVVSAACASSAKVFGAAARALRAGLCDAAVVGGVDSLCLTTLQGFRALQLVSSDICRPADVARNGLSIGEAGGFALVTRDARPGSLALVGFGESSDAHHMSQPRPDAGGAILAMRLALRSAGLDPSSIDYVNLHGTATPANDAMEDLAVTQVLGTSVDCSSTKGWTGHTLGAAGILEAVISLLALEHDFRPRSLNTLARDPALRARVLLESVHAPVRYAMSNSFGFGGANCALVFGRAA